LSTVFALVLDTSSAAVTAGVVEVTGAGVKVLAEHVEINSRGHGEYLAPVIDASLSECALAPDELSAIVVGTGPGPFTGLRVGLVTAAVMAETLGIPAYGVCSLDAIAAVAPAAPDLLVVTDARRKEVYWARYERGRRTAGPDVSTPSAVEPGDVTVGLGTLLYPEVFGAEPLDLPYPSVLGLATCATDRLSSGAPSDPLTPLYLRRPDAQPPAAPKAVSQ
jgi:tRNA threonylcarbamoyl adenosine modification protein YeaZ